MRWDQALRSTTRRGDLRAQVRELAQRALTAGGSPDEVQQELLAWALDQMDDRDDMAAIYTEIADARRSAQARPKSRAAVVFPDLHTSGRREGLPISHSLANIETLLAAYECEARYNQMTHRLELDTPALTCSQERRANIQSTWWRHVAQSHGMQRDVADEYLALVAREYHPVREWILEHAGDGVDRVSELVAMVKTSDALAPTLIRRWLAQCVAALEEGDDFRPAGVLVFSGAQGIGKTSWLRSLLPAGSRWGAIGMGLDPSRRDDVQALTRYWIAELGELDATFRRADVAALKAFVDRDRDVYRSAYARREEEVKRRTVLFASVNRPDFLADDTGNRRWWTVRAERCEWRHGIDLAQLWAQVWHERQRGADYRLTEQELEQLARSNEQSEAVDPLACDLWERWAIGDGADYAHRLTLRQIVERLPEGWQGSQYARTSRGVARLLRAAGVPEGRKPQGRGVWFAVVARA